MKIHFYLITSILLFSCSEKKEDSGKSDGSEKTDYSSTIIAEDPTEEELKKELSETELEKISNVTSMSFDKTVHDYGKVISVLAPLQSVVSLPNFKIGLAVIVISAVEESGQYWS